jgi:hypothetical protein
MGTKKMLQVPLGTYRELSKFMSDPDKVWGIRRLPRD